MKLILQAIKALYNKLKIDFDNRISSVEKSIPQNPDDIGALSNSVTHLPNPFPMEFSGGVLGSYDGSNVCYINIPKGFNDESFKSLNFVLQGLATKPSDFERITILSDQAGIIKTGIYMLDGELYYYENNTIQPYMGLIEYLGSLYYVRSEGQLATDDYWVINDNGLLTQGMYHFNEVGRLENKYYKVTRELNCVNSSYTAKYFSEGVQHNKFTTTLTPNEGYSISTVTVTMGGEDITTTAYIDGVVTIETVIGDIVITSTAEAIE